MRAFTYNGEAPTDGYPPAPIDCKQLLELFLHQLAHAPDCADIIRTQLAILREMTMRVMYIPAGTKLTPQDIAKTDEPQRRYSDKEIEDFQYELATLRFLAKDGVKPMTLKAYEDCAKDQATKVGEHRWWIAWKSNGDCPLLTTSIEPPSDRSRIWTRIKVYEGADIGEMT